MNQIISAIPDVSAPQHTFAAVTAPLKFLRPQATKPRFLSSALTGGAPELMFESDDINVQIHDMRLFADDLSVDHEGFALVRHRTDVIDLYDDAAVQAKYHPEIEDLLKRELGVSRVEIFDTTRRTDAGDGAANADGRRGPASRIHVDYTEKSGPVRLADVVGSEEAARLESTGTRVAQINVWRPITGPVERSPLALADASSINTDDLIATDQVFPDRVGEIYHLTHAAEQRWYYASEMDRSEVLLIKGWDSLDDGRAKFTPHTAFDLPGPRQDAPARESIEVRTFVIFD